jgi:hypothetical protein
MIRLDTLIYVWSYRASDHGTRIPVMTQMLTLSAIAKNIGSMVKDGFLKFDDVKDIAKLYHAEHISLGEEIEMLQELIDVATIKKLSKKDNSHGQGNLVHH